MRMQHSCRSLSASCHSFHSCTKNCLATYHQLQTLSSHIQTRVHTHTHTDTHTHRRQVFIHIRIHTHTKRYTHANMQTSSDRVNMSCHLCLSFFGHFGCVSLPFLASAFLCGWSLKPQSPALLSAGAFLSPLHCFCLPT